MFVTLPQFHQPLLSAVALGGQQQWSALAAHFPVQPWYVFVYEATFLDSRMNHTMLVAWEEQLVQIISSVPANDHRAVYRIDPEEDGRLVFKSLQAVWAPSTAEAETGIGAAFRFEAQSQVLGADLRPVSKRQSRSLVFGAGRDDREAADDSMH